MMKISVIIAVYNVAKFVERCMLSLINQTMQEGVEVIIVNDGSCDNSMDIIRQILEQYGGGSRMTFRIIEHKENRGPAAVCNTAMSCATGDYTIHIDCDDYVELDMIEKMYTKAMDTDADIVIADIWKEYGDHAVYINAPDASYPRSFLGDIIRAKCSYLPTKLIRRSLYVENAISWTEREDIAGDYSVMVPLCFAAKKIVNIPYAFYHYVQYNQTSITKRKVSKREIDAWIHSTNKMKLYLESRNIMGYDEDIAYKQLLTRLNCVVNSSGKQRKEYVALFPEADKYIPHFLRTFKSPKARLLNYCLLKGYFEISSSLLLINRMYKKVFKQVHHDKKIH